MMYPEAPEKHNFTRIEVAWNKPRGNSNWQPAVWRYATTDECHIP
jgi:hypothetical protein